MCNVVSHQANVQENTGLLLRGKLRKDATTVFVHMVNSQARCVSPGLEQRAELKRQWRYLQTLAFYAETMWLLSDSHLVEIWELFQQIILPDCLYSCAASSLEATQSVNFSPAVRVCRCSSGGEKKEERFKGIQLQLRLMLVWHYFGLTGGTSFRLRRSLALGVWLVAERWL